MEEVKQLITQTLADLRMFVRDVDLSDQLIQQYRPGMIICERGFTDASSRIGGLGQRCRYLIVSNHMANMAQFDNAHWGLYVAKPSAHFQVIDVFRHEQKVQIALLHLPDGDAWRPFETITLQGLNLVETVRQRFIEQYAAPLIPELASPDWRQRCQPPLGIDDTGTLFPL